MTSLFKFEDYIDLENQVNDLFSAEDLPADEAKSPPWSSASPPGTPTDTNDWLSLVDYNDSMALLSRPISELAWSMDDHSWFSQDIFAKQNWMMPLSPFRLSESPSLMLSADDPVLGLSENVGPPPPTYDYEGGAGDITKSANYVTSDTTPSAPAFSPKQQSAGTTQHDQGLTDIEPRVLPQKNTEESKPPDRKSKRKAGSLEPMQKATDSDDPELQARHKRKKTRGQKVYCLCRQPDTGEAMVQCDQCNKWFHCACMSLDPDKAVSLETWKCNSCCAKATANVKGTSPPPPPPPSSSLSPSKPPRRSLRQATKNKYHSV